MNARHELILYAGTVINTSFAERIAAARAGGFGAISLFPHDYLGAQRDGLDDVAMRAALERAGIAVAVIDPVTTWLPGSAPPADAPAELIAFAQHEPAELFAIAKAVGAPAINALEFWGARVDVGEAARAFAALCDAAAEAGLRVHLEAMPFSGIPDVQTAWAVVDGAGRDNGGLLLDSWHWFRGQNRLEVLRSIPPEAIFAVQLSDGPTLAAPDLQTESMQARLLPGEGDFPLRTWLEAIAQTGAQPTFGPEVFSAALAAEPPAAVAGVAARTTRTVLDAGAAARGG